MACCGHTSQSCGHRWSRCPACLELCEENQRRRWKSCCFLHAPLPSNCSSLVGSYQFVRTCRSLLCLIFMCAGLPENVRLRSYWKNIPEHPHDVILQCKTQMIKKGRVLVSCSLLHLATAARTKQWMHQKEYTHHFLFLPRVFAMQNLPIGVPSGLVWFECKVA